MARVFITGSADGLGRMAAKLLVQGGHHVVLHARNAKRAEDARAAVPQADAVVVGDVSTIAAMLDVAREASALGPFDAVIHNVAIGYQEREPNLTKDGLPLVFAINSLAPYVLTAKLPASPRVIYMSSGLHRSGDARMDDLAWKSRRWNGTQAYSDSKLHNVLLAFAVARRRPGAFVNAVHPGWVATKMGGAGAPDDLALGAVTQTWLAVGEDPKTHVTAEYFFHQKTSELHPRARDVALQDEFLAACALLSGIKLEA